VCGRYLFSAEEYSEFRQIAEDVQRRCGTDPLNFPMAGDVLPSRSAPVLIGHDGKVNAELQTWGLPARNGGRIINARAETVREKPMFRSSILARRCVVPACGFYEWDAAKHKYYFRLPGHPLYLAGIYDSVEGVRCFVILTTAPNDSMRDIHDRMPLILPPDAIRPWLTDPEAALRLLAGTPPLLERTRTDGQLSLADYL
jgi:putative SOS response-associated peptidase YedK